MTGIINFLKLVKENQKVRKEIEEKESLYSLNAEKTKISYKAFLEKEIIPIAKKYGFSFTVDDYVKFMNDNSTKLLSEYELEEVAGGKKRVVLPSVMAAISLVQGSLSQSVTTYAMHSSTASHKSKGEISDNMILTEKEKEVIDKFCKNVGANIDDGEYINYKDEKDQTLLHMAAILNVNEVAELLISKGADINAKDEHGKTPLHIAAMNDANKVAELLISKGADINAKDKYGNAPLHTAAMNDANKVAELLISKGADINAKDNDEETPLHAAAQNDANKVAELLISKGADINVKDKYGNAPLHTAAMNDANEVAELLISKGADINAKDKYGNAPLHTAAMNDANEVAELLISKGADINAKDNDEETPLHAAAQNDANKVAELLISKGAGIDEKNKFGKTPLHYAAENDAREVAELLISKGADINAKDNDEETPLHTAVRNDAIKVVELLVSKGADVNTKSQFGETPLDIAKKKNSTEVIELLKQKEASAVSETNVETEQISEKSENKDEEQVDLNQEINVPSMNFFNLTKDEELICIGDKLGVSKVNSDINFKYGDSEETLLHIATNKGLVEVAELLISKGADVNAKNEDGETPLHFAASANAKGIANLLLENGADIDVREDVMECTPLHLAAENDAGEVAELLISKGADINAKDVWESSVLHYAAENDARKVAELLISKGADINAKNRDGKIPLDIATEKNATNVIEMLKRKEVSADKVNKKVEDGNQDVESQFLIDSQIYTNFQNFQFNSDKSDEEFFNEIDIDEVIRETMENPNKENFTMLFDIYKRLSNYNDVDNVAKRMNIYRHVLQLSNVGNKIAFRFIEVVNKKDKSEYPSDFSSVCKDIGNDEREEIEAFNKRLDEEYAKFLIEFAERNNISLRDGLLLRVYDVQKQNNNPNPFAGNQMIAKDRQAGVHNITSAEAECFNEFNYWLPINNKHSKQKGGWKIHISAQPQSAKKVAELVLTYLEKQEVCAKISITLQSMRLLAFGENPQNGKFITIYTENSEQAKTITNDLDKIISDALKKGTLQPRDFCECVGDLKIGNTGAIYARCGSYFAFDDFSKMDNRFCPIPGEKVIANVAEKRIVLKKKMELSINKLKAEIKEKEKKDNPTVDEQRSLNTKKKALKVEQDKFNLLQIPENGFDRNAPFDLDISFLGEKIEKENIFERYQDLMDMISKKKWRNFL